MARTYRVNGSGGEGPRRARHHTPLAHNTPLAHKSPAYLEKQPFGKIPYIDDDSFILCETRAICRYIVVKYPASRLIPSDPKAHALFEQAAAVEVAEFDPSAAVAVREMVMKPMFGMPNDLEEAKKALTVFGAKLDAYDVTLAKQRYVAGESLTLADLFHIPCAPLLAKGGSDIMTYVARWYNELVARPSWNAYLDGVKTTTAY
ncbi:glutathione S-transferase [Mycena crocata]|nr:glutathione S-transferase [Mycena crocata]